MDWESEREWAKKRKKNTTHIIKSTAILCEFLEIWFGRNFIGFSVALFSRVNRLTWLTQKEKDAKHWGKIEANENWQEQQKRDRETFKDTEKFNTLFHERFGHSKLIHINTRSSCIHTNTCRKKIENSSIYKWDKSLLNAFQVTCENKNQIITIDLRTLLMRCRAIKSQPEIENKKTL